jgi:hypothetical protein
MNTIVPVKMHGDSAAQGGARVPPPGVDQTKEKIAVLDLKLLALTHPWLERDITDGVHRMHADGVPFEKILQFMNENVAKFDLQTRAAWERTNERRAAMIQDPELRATLAPRNQMEAALFAAMDATDAMRAETAAMDDDFEREVAERQARIAAHRADAAAAEARTKAMVDEVEKKKFHLFRWLVG